MTKIKFIITIISTLSILTIGFFIIGGIISSGLEVEKIKLSPKEDKISISVLHISDLHYPKNGIELNEIIRQAKALKPDLIFLTGDIIDSITEQKDIQDLNGFFYALSSTAKTYAVHGNHETINENLLYYNAMLSSNNIVLINNAYEIISIKGRYIAIAGLDDSKEFTNQNISSLDTLSPSIPLLLLAHRPEYWQDYLSHPKIKPLATFSGHAHGGQFRFFGKGVYSPNQGFFPKYYDGLYKQKDNFMIVSRGLGNSMMNLRLYNKFHLPFVKIYI